MTSVDSSPMQEQTPPGGGELPITRRDRVGTPTHRSSWRVHPDTVLGGILLGAAVVGGWPVYLAITAPMPVLPAPLVAHVCGMLAGYAVIVLIVLMSRWPLLERSVGSDRLARWHSRGGPTVLTLMLVHGAAAAVAWSQARGESLVTALIEVMGMPGLLTATLGTAVMVAVAVLSARAARRRLSFEVWHGIHLLMYIGVALSFAHQLAGPDLVQHRLLQVVWALMYAHAFALVIRHRFIQPLQAASRHRLRVSRVVREAPGVVSIRLAGAHLDELRAESGQFFRWRFLTPDTWFTAHPFSLSAAPTDSELRLTVKDLGDGSRLLQSIDAGTWVVAEGPYGVMTAAARSRRDVLLVAGGVGITPMRALFETMPVTAGQDLLLLYRARTPEQIVFRDELDAIAERRGIRLRYLLGDDRSALSGTGLLAMVPNLAERDVYLCGPPAMADAVRATLLACGLPTEQLHEERFAF